MSEQLARDKHRPADRRKEQDSELRAKAAQQTEKTERKPSRIERREWRGSGVCGDRRTD